MRLSIYISHRCANCQEALAIAARARRISSLEVAVVNLDEPRQAIPPGVVAVPTYLLNGRVVSLGNPEPRRFLDGLARQVKESTA